MRVNGSYINGAAVVGDKPKLSVVNPATGDKCAEFEDCGVDELNTAVAAAKAAFDGKWGSYTVKQRAAVMLKIHALINKHATELAQLIVEENGKNLAEALADVAKGNETVEWACSLPQLIGGRKLEVRHLWPSTAPLPTIKHICNAPSHCL
jgi:acyl-CoA reductase-like NAD-dependent aldehyde dehydrogenase